MPNTASKPAYYVITRIGLYVILTGIVLWIIIGASLSVGYSVFYEHEREVHIPETVVTAMESPAEALACLRGMRVFQNELTHNVKLFIKGYGKKPKRSKVLWNRWLAEWRADFERFGRQYSFDRQPEMSNRMERKLKAAYDRLDKLARDYATQFDRLAEIHSTERSNLKSLYDNLEGEWRDAQ